MILPSLTTISITDMHTKKEDYRTSIYTNPCMVIAQNLKKNYICQAGTVVQVK